MTLLGKGVFVPVPTFFKENEDLDLAAFDQHIQYLSNTGLAGIVVLGSMGEAVNLTEAERVQVISQYVTCVKKHDPNLKLIVGCSGQSVYLTLHYIRQAYDAGAGFALVLPPSYYKVSINQESLYQFYTSVADESPLPIVIYNYPGVSQGTDLSVQLLAQLSKHKNIIGIKATDGNVSKMTNLASKINPDEIALLAGSADFFLPELLVGAVGLIPGVGNALPALCVQIQKLFEQGKMQEAVELQKKMVEADYALCKGHGIPGIKSFIQQRLGYGNGKCRQPLLKVAPSVTDHMEATIAEVWKLEQCYHS